MKEGIELHTPQTKCMVLPDCKPTIRSTHVAEVGMKAKRKDETTIFQCSTLGKYPRSATSFDGTSQNPSILHLS